MNIQSQRAPRIFLPSDKTRPADQFTRAAFAHAKAVTNLTSAEKICQERWPQDEATALITRGAVSPATTATPAWAGVLAPTGAVGAFVETLAPQSAASQIFARSTVVSLDGVGQITVPRRSAPPTGTEVSFIAPGEPITVAQLTLAGTTLGPARKLAVIIVATNELLESSAAEQVFAAMVRENVAAALDASFFSNAAATTARPAGILNGIGALAATAGGGEAAMVGDLDKLATAISDAAGEIVLVANPRQAFSIRIRLGTRFDIPVIASRAVPAGTVVALDPAAVAVRFGAVPRFESSEAPVIHMDDALALPIGTAGAPPSVASPARSMFQTNCTATRCILPAAWAVRSPGAIAWISGAVWA